jgi:two-component system response regulator YesN
MFAQPGSSIKTVALELGFEEPSYFNKLFNKAYGINPSEYKKLLLYQT